MNATRAHPDAAGVFSGADFPRHAGDRWALKLANTPGRPLAFSFASMGGCGLGEVAKFVGAKRS